jgi:hypothetical protein
MSYYLRVYCAADRLLDAKALMDFIQEGYFFEEDPAFEDLESARPPNQFSFAVRYSPDLRPILISCTKDATFIHDEISVLFTDIPPDLPEKYLQRLAKCNLLYCFEIKPDTLAEPAWEMLSCLEVYLAKQLNGLIYAPGDGLYDATMALISKAE